MRAKWWKSLMAIGATAGLVLALVGPPVRSTRADSSATDIAVSHLEAGTLADGESELAKIVAAHPEDQDALLGLGVMRTMLALEHLSQGLYRYGLTPPEAFMAPVIRLPVPENPNPESITYQDFRGLLLAFYDDLSSAEATLAKVQSSDVAMVLDLKQVRYDANGDGASGDDERLMAVVQHLSGLNASEMPASLTFEFDIGDVYWLRGYEHILMAIDDFFLAHDWQQSFDASFFHFFPAMHSPLRDALPPAGDLENDQYGPIADLVSFVHIPWPVTEPERMAEVRAHLEQTIAMSRQSWQAIAAETDDDREWIPSATQTSPFASLQVTPERIAAWYKALDEAEAILDGDKLVPHWRFEQGVNLRRFFDEPQTFDLVLLTTGPGVLPYLEDGPKTSADDWNQVLAAFGNSFGLFALWVN